MRSPILTLFKCGRTRLVDSWRYLLFTLLMLSAQPLGFALESQLEFFERRIRPLLIERCIECHSNDDRSGGLSLESREGWADRQVIEPGSPDLSLLLKAVRHEEPGLEIPPPDHSPKLSLEEIGYLEQWIRSGAVDPRFDESTSAASGLRRRPRAFSITDQDRAHWAFQPLKTVSRSQSPQSTDEIDHLIDQKLAAIKVTRNPPASPRELVRRATFDLWGLPPSPEAVQEFERDPSPEAWRQLIDRLLESEFYGQRWGRYWLDWVRYAETNGYERDGPKPNAWRYRDYVIRAFNEDKPYDRFLHEQLAGDLLIEREGLSASRDRQSWQDAIIATGFYRLHVWDDEPDSSDAAEYDELDDTLVTIGSSMMGLTLGCARCHDHKFDPISQSDYYSLLDLLRDIDPYGLPKHGGGGRGTGQIDRFLVDSEVLQSWHQEKQTALIRLERELQISSSVRQAELQEEIEQLRRSDPPYDKALAVGAPPTGRKATFVLIRGDHQYPGQPVTADVPQILKYSGDQCAESDRSKIATRLEFAQWLTGPNQALTARVMANRIWQQHFGQGIAISPDDFGLTGRTPDNLELLDWLARALIEGGWSIKSLHRAILLSQAYQMSSRQLPSPGPAPLDVTDKPISSSAHPDPDNRLFWRQNLRRLDAEAIRDAMLYYSQTLVLKRDGPSVFFELSSEVKTSAEPELLASWGSSPLQEQDCRSVFLAVKRSLKMPFLEALDFANSSSPVSLRSTTTVAPQALMLLNDAFVQEQARRLSLLLLACPDVPSDRLTGLWRIVFQRAPSQAETHQALDYLRRHEDTARAWQGLCRIVLNTSEAVYVD